MTRDEHVAWCKERALEYCDAGELANAIASMGSDLGKHPDTANHPAIKLGVMMLLAGQLATTDAVRKFILGFR